MAWDTNGNYVVLDQRAGGGVFFRVHELPRESFKLANNFGEFLEVLEPFADLPDSEAEVISVWVDPEFLKKYGKNATCNNTVAREPVNKKVLVEDACSTLKPRRFSCRMR